jgi:ribosome-associated protein
MRGDDLISKTRRKRQMHELQAVGEALTRLPRESLARLELPEALREAVLDARRFTKHEARRRQMQYIGRLMRDLDVGPIEAQLTALTAPSKRDTALFHLAEKWRTDILADRAALQRFVQAFPEADPHRLRELAEAASEEIRQERTPKQFRELFHTINAILRDHARRHP